MMFLPEVKNPLCFHVSTYSAHSDSDRLLSALSAHVLVEINSLLLL